MLFNSLIAVSIAARSCASCAFLQLGHRVFDRLFLVGRELVAEFLQLFFRLEDQAVRLVELVGPVACDLVGIGVGFGLFLHLLDLLLAEAAAGLDADALLLARGFVLGAHVQDAVRIDVEGHFDLRQCRAGLVGCRPGGSGRWCGCRWPWGVRPAARGSPRWAGCRWPC
jgi:hypothetical protein